MEGPTHPMMITILLIFDAPIELERLQAVFLDRLRQYPRFRQRVVQPGEDGDSAAWEDDPALDLDYHLKQSPLPTPGDERALRAVVGKLMSQQLDLTRPPWQFHLIEPYDTGCALLGRVHHCLADGPALMHLLLALTDSDPSSSRSGTAVRAPTASPGPAPGIAARFTKLLVQQGFNILFNPFHLHDLAQMGTGTMTAVGKLLWRAPDPNTIFKGELGVPKQVAWSRPVPLAEVKAIGRAVGGTVNDVMLAAAAGALRGYLVDRGEPVTGLSIRAGLSVNLRDPSAYPSPGNEAGAVLVDLPVGLDTSLSRLRHVQRGMDELKNSPEASVVWALMNALGKAPVDTMEKLVETYCTRETTVIANVPGPPEKVYLAGARLSTLIFWAPALGGAGLCLSIASYAGQVWFGIGSDQGLVQDPEELVAGFHAEFEALQHLTEESTAEQDAATVSEGPFEAMNALLDQAIGKVDEMLEGR